MLFFSTQAVLFAQKSMNMKQLMYLQWANVCFPNSRCRDQDERPETIGGGRVLDLQSGLHPNVMGMNSGEPNDF